MAIFLGDLVGSNRGTSSTQAPTYKEYRAKNSIILACVNITQIIYTYKLFICMYQNVNCITCTVFTLHIAAACVGWC